VYITSCHSSVYSTQLQLVMSENDFLLCGLEIANHDVNRSANVGANRFRSLFGATPKVCSILWISLADTVPAYSESKHLLWALLFLKTYTSEHVMHALTGADEKTVRKWVWIFVQLISDLHVVSK
jgi:hypothetical protein